jgi:hypothetical protein
MNWAEVLRILEMEDIHPDVFTYVLKTKRLMIF